MRILSLKALMSTITIFTSSTNLFVRLLDAAKKE